MSRLTAFEIAFQALCQQVKTAKIRDAACLEHLTAATAEWKETNAELTAANKALDTFLSNACNELTRVASGDETRVTDVRQHAVSLLNDEDEGAKE